MDAPQLSGIDVGSNMVMWWYCCIYCRRQNKRESIDCVGWVAWL